MNIICIILGLNIFVTFLFKREWLLQWRPFIILLAINTALFVTAGLLQNNAVGNPNLVAALKIPAPQQLLFISLLLIYRAIFNRNPQDTWHTMDWKLMKDGIFNFIFWASSAVPVLLALDNVI
jgi:hypothetical protein